MGFVTNRLNIAITGVENAVGGRYTPKWTEVVITAMFVALGFAIFGLVAKYLPIFPEEKAQLPALREARKGSTKLRCLSMRETDKSDRAHFVANTVRTHGLPPAGLEARLQH